jgi:hypothetical protein
MLETEDPIVKETILLEITRRRESFAGMAENVQKLESEREASYKKVLGQESYFCRSQLLHFLHARRYAVKPRPLANALAGLSYMRWRQSHLRCSKMAYDNEPHLWYRTWEAMRKIWRRNRTEFGKPPVEFFRTAILKLPKKSAVRQYICKNWRDFRIAIEQSWDPHCPFERVPFALTANFVQNVMRPKNSVEQVLAAQEQLISSETA